MDIGSDVTLWRGGVVEQDEQPDSGPAYHLFQETTIAFSSLLRVLIQDPSYVDPRLYKLLREEFRKYYMWNEGFCTRAGDLDQVLSSSKNLKGTVLNLMVLWARAISKVPRIRTMSQYDWTAVLSTFADLNVLSYKVDQVARAAVADMNSHCSVVSSLDTGYDSDSDTDTESFASDEDVDEIIEDMKAYMESLMDLSPSLDHPAMDTAIIEDLGTTLIDDLSGVSEPARPFVLIIRDRFPSLEIGLARKLGEANWQRRQRLREKLSSAPVMTENSSLDDDNSSSADTVVGRQHQNAPDTATQASIVRSSLSIPSTYQSITTGSKFSDPSIFDNQSIIAPRASRPFSYAESMTSFATSMADGLEYGQRRIPNMPDHEYDASFQCHVCGDVLTRIRHRADWKKHVYGDLEPYVCLTTDCKLGLHTFRSRGEWTTHEFQNHRVTSQWSCNLCSETFDSEVMFQDHVNNIHFQDVAQSQVEEVISASKRLIPRNVVSEKCPFCLTTPATNQKAFASHVGKHLQEVSLAALPNIDGPDEGGSSDDSDGGDDGHPDDTSDKEEEKDDSTDSDGRSSSEGSIRTVTSLQGTTRPKRPDPDSPSGEFDGEEVPDQSTMAMTDEEWFERMSETQEGMGSTSSPHTSCSASSPRSSVLIEPNDTYPSFNIDRGFITPSLLPPQLPTSYLVPSPDFAGTPSQLSQLATSTRHKHSLSQDSQSSIKFTSGSQNRLAFTAKDFEKTLSRCTDLVESTLSLVPEMMPLLLASFGEEIRSLSTLVQNLTSSSSGLPNRMIEKAIETLAICRTQLLRLQRFLESTNSNFETLQKKTKRQSRGLSRIFGHPASTDLFDIPKGETILVDLKTGRSVLAKLIADVPPRVNLSDLEFNSSLRLSESENTVHVTASPGESMTPTSLGQPKEARAILPTEPYGSDLLIPEYYGAYVANALLSWSKDSTAQIKRWLDGVGDVNSKLTDDGNALQIAAARGSIEVVQLLLDHGADPNIDVGDYGPPLQSAAKLGTRSRVQLLLDFGANVNTRGGYFGSALRAAAVNDRLSIFRLLMHHGAEFSRDDRLYVQAFWESEKREGVSKSKELVDLVFNFDFSKSQYSVEQSRAQATWPAASRQYSETLPMRASANDIFQAFGPPIRGNAIHDFDAPHPPRSLSQNETVKSLSQKGRSVSPENRGSASPLTRELLESRFQENFGIRNNQTTTASKTNFESQSNTGNISVFPFEEGTDATFGTGRLDETIYADVNRAEKRNEPLIRALYDEAVGSLIDDMEHPCEACGQIIIEGKAFELVGRRWHFECFRCAKCRVLCDSDTNLLLLADGSLICSNCTYSCSACKNKIEDLAILTAARDQAFCTACFRCRNCKRKIENLRYAKTSQGIFCMSCHESLMARRRKKRRAAADAKLKPQATETNRNAFDGVPPVPPIDPSPATRLQQDPDTSPAESSKINDDVDADD